MFSIVTIDDKSILSYVSLLQPLNAELLTCVGLIFDPNDSKLVQPLKQLCGIVVTDVGQIQVVSAVHP